MNIDRKLVHDVPGTKHNSKCVR